MGDAVSHRKALELINNNSLIHHMLTFLVAVPFESIASTPTNDVKHISYQERFDSIMPCLLTSNEPIRRSASKVVDRIFGFPQIMEEWKKSEAPSSLEFKRNIWSLT